MQIKTGQLVNKIGQTMYDGWTGINASSLKKFLVSPLHYKTWIDNKPDEKVGDAFRIGTAVHMAILEPDLFPQRYMYAPEVDRRTTAGKLAWTEFTAGLNAKQDNFLFQEEVAMVDGMISRVRENQFWKLRNDWNDNLYVEAGFECEYLGVKIKGRLDFYNASQNVIIDWKTINDTPTKRTVKSEIYSKGYDVQAFFYQKGVEIVSGTKPKFLFAFIEKKEPYSIGFYELPQWRIDEVQQVVDVELVRMQNAKETGIYAGLPAESSPIIVE
jgi:exodeoxyribonuclease VIII